MNAFNVTITTLYILAITFLVYGFISEVVTGWKAARPVASVAPVTNWKHEEAEPEAEPEAWNAFKATFHEFIMEDAGASFTVYIPPTQPVEQVEIEEECPISRKELKTKTVRELRLLCYEKGIKAKSTAKKADLINLLS